MLEAVVESVSRAIDDFCGRRFWAVTQTRLFTARHPCELLLGAADLLAVTTLKTDDDGDRVYGTDAALVRDSKGVYHVDWSVTAAGVHQYRFVGTGTAQGAASGSFLARESNL